MNKNQKIHKDTTLQWCENSLKNLKRTKNYLSDIYAQYLKEKELQRKFKKYTSFKSLKNREFRKSITIPAILLSKEITEKFSSNEESVTIVDETKSPTHKLTYILSQSNFDKKRIPVGYYNRVYKLTVVEEPSDKFGEISVQDTLEIIDAEIQYLETFIDNFSKDKMVLYKEPKITLFEESNLKINDDVKKERVSSKKSVIVQEVKDVPKKRHSYLELAHLYAKLIDYQSANNPKYREVLDEIERFEKSIKELTHYEDLKYKKPEKRHYKVRKHSLLSKWIGVK